MSDQHPLVCRCGAFGDMVMITPLLKRLYQRSGMACDVVAIGGWSRTMFQHMPYVRNVYVIKSRKTPYIFSSDKRKLAKQIREHQYAYAWICEQLQQSYQLMQKSDIDIDHSINALAMPRLPHEHVAQQWLRLANESPDGCDYPVDGDAELNTELFVSTEEVAECRRWLQSLSIDPDAPLICIQAGNKRTMRAGKVQRESNTKYWHQRNWAAVIDTITEELPDAHVLLCGVPAEHAMTLDIHDLCHQQQRIHCVANDLPMRRLLALLSIAHSCISVDTGPAHAAAALDCPVTVLFGKADARLCSPVSSESAVAQVVGRITGSELDITPQSWAECHDIKLITVDDVIRGWRESVSP